jgi:8-hydroxy-5-deazaflavin:NADPH oxidoreductase
MEMGTIGAGDFAQAFAKLALKAGHKIKLSNGRGAESLLEIINRLGPGVMAATKEEAAACEMVLLAVPWDNVPETLVSLPKWKNQILIDGTNPFHGKEGHFKPAMLETYLPASWLRHWPWSTSGQGTEQHDRS